MKCPYCSSSLNKVTDKRESQGANVTRRRRECTDCGKRFTTFERIELANLMVVKKDGTRESFSRDKVLSGILKATEKRPISADTIDKMADSVETVIRKNHEKEADSSEIGRLISEELKHVDKVAYIRFASVYKDFKDVETFEEEIKNLRTLLKQ